MKVLVIAGGISGEREVSLRSGRACYDALSRLDYNVDFLDLKNISDLIELQNEKKYDKAFLCTHGNYGEDGRLQSVLDWIGLSYTGSNALSSAVCMNKYCCRQLLKASNINIAEGNLLSEYNDSELEGSIPCVIKKLESGSTIGVYIIHSESDLKNFYLSEANLNPRDWVVEKFVSGQEITVGVIKINNEYKALPILEIRPLSGVYDYHAKYTKGMTEFIIPANLSEKVTESAKKLAVETFNILGCRGYARVDMIVPEEAEPVVLEVNTLPGMTGTSDLPQQALAEGISYDELVELMLLSSD